jgi:hypothetical protein
LIFTLITTILAVTIGEGMMHRWPLRREERAEMSETEHADDTLRDIYLLVKWRDDDISPPLYSTTRKRSPILLFSEASAAHR